MPSVSVPADPKAPPERESEPSERPNLARRYGSIGIPAVAAAARYHIAARNPAYAPVRQPLLVHEDAVA